MKKESSRHAGAEIPEWALGQAMGQLVDGDDRAIRKRARKLLHDFDNERHGEDDDLEEGGEG
jgi:hypothetical protein